MRKTIMLALTTITMGTDYVFAWCPTCGGQGSVDEICANCNSRGYIVMPTY